MSRYRSAALVLVVMFFAGCAQGPEASGGDVAAGSGKTVAVSSGSWATAEVVGPLVRTRGESKDGMAAEVTGRLDFRDGCLLLDGEPVVWPQGTTWDPDSESIGLPDGQRASLGAVVTGGGGYSHIDAIESLFGPVAAGALHGCVAPTGEVAIFNPGSEVASADNHQSGN